MKVIRREGFDYRDKRYEIVVEHVGFKLKVAATLNGRTVKNSEIFGDLDAATDYNSAAGMGAVDALIGLVQNRVRGSAR
jgi:hypothetical protein